MTSLAGPDAVEPRSPLARGLSEQAVADQGGLLRACPLSGNSPAVTLPPDGPALTAAEAASVIEAAACAPLLRRGQRWQFRPRPDAIDLVASPAPPPAVADCAARELMISCGAAVFGLRLGMRRIGRLARTDLLPDPARPDLVARVWPAGHASRTAAESDLIAAAGLRSAHCGAFSPGEVPARLLTALAADARAEDCTLVVLEDELLGELGGLAPPPVHPAREPRRRGLPASGPVTAVLLTAGDTPADWLRAGQALDRMLLRAAARWVFARLLPVSSPRLRQAVAAMAGGTGCPQLVLRLGRANTAPGLALQHARIVTPVRPADGWPEPGRGGDLLTH
jgi:hypothetical protein